MLAQSLLPFLIELAFAVPRDLSCESWLERSSVLTERAANRRRFVRAGLFSFGFDPPASMFVLVSYACSLISRVICRVRFVRLCRCDFREFVPN